jgi:hypothetical protein
MKNQVFFIKGLDVTSMVKIIDGLTKKMQALILSKLETYVPNEYFSDVRKIVLDATNDCARDIIRTLIGDVEV